MLTVQTLVGFAEKAKVHTPERVHHHANLTSVEDDDHYDEDMSESANACQAHNDPVDPVGRLSSSGLMIMRIRHVFFVCCSG